MLTAKKVESNGPLMELWLITSVFILRSLLSPDMQSCKHKDRRKGSLDVRSTTSRGSDGEWQLRSASCGKYQALRVRLLTQSELQFIRQSRGQSLLEQCGVKALAQGPNGCVDLIEATPGLEPPTAGGYTNTIRAGTVSIGCTLTRGLIAVARGCRSFLSSFSHKHDGSLTTSPYWLLWISVHIECYCNFFLNLLFTLCK